MSLAPTQLTRLRRITLASVSQQQLTVAAAVGITVVATSLRIWHLGLIGLNSDESVYTGQAASLAGDGRLAQYFSPFRAHPLDLQTMLAGLFAFTGVSDYAARLFVALVFGVGGCAAVGLLAWRMYGRSAGLVAMTVIAVMPYHVMLSRQVTLDVPVMMFETLFVWCVFEFINQERSIWLIRSAPFLGLAVATKETAVLMAPAMVLAVVWCQRWRSMRPAVVGLWALLAALPVLPFAFSRMIWGGYGAGGYVYYQFSRPANHDWWYFGAVLLFFVGVPALIFAISGLVVMGMRRGFADRVMLAWLIPLGVFFQFWPTKLFPYIVVLAPVGAIAIARSVITLAPWASQTLDLRFGRRVSAAMVVTVLTLALSTVLAISAATDVSNGAERTTGPFSTDIELQDFAGGREAAQWIGRHTPPGSVFMTIGPSIGNIISFYGDRDWYALSVSANPKLRNPAYRPIPNPDLMIRDTRVQYAVWDAYSADRSAFYNARLMRYVRRFDGQRVLTVWRLSNGAVRSARTAPPGADVRVVIYDLAGGDPGPRGATR
jgi:Dolichyl-phosphate-mannose-protein mannosyltransferase